MITVWKFGKDNNTDDTHIKTTKTKQRPRLAISKPIRKTQYITFHYTTIPPKEKMQLKRLFEYHRFTRTYFDPEEVD